jgi:excisionase family DNA binding protein
MSAIAALIRELGEDAIIALAERLRPHLIAGTPAGDGWLRGAEQIAAHLGCPRSRVYALASAGRIPVHRDGSALLARRSELDDWLRAGGGRRP